MKGRCMPESTKKKLSLAMSGRKGPNLGKTLSDVTKEKLRNKALGRVISKETRKKISIALKGRKGEYVTSEETKEKLRQKALGRTLSEQTRKKLSLALTGRKITYQARKKISDALKGRKHSPKSIEKRCGEKNGNWKGGKTTLIQKARNCYEYRQWRSDVYTRDNFTCQECGSNKGGSLEAHHIVSFSSLIKKYNLKNIEEVKSCVEIWNINNGVTLCNSCHKKTDSYLNNKRKII